MNYGAVAGRWAGALFELASAKGVLDEVERDVQLLARELDAKGVADHLFDARVPQAVKRQRIEQLGGHLNQFTYNFLRLLLDRRRLEVLREFPAAFRDRLLRERGQVEGVVESARELGAPELESLAAAVGAQLGKQVSLEARLVPELLAGVRVFVDNKLVDSSASGRLEELRDKLLAARL